MSQAIATPRASGAAIPAEAADDLAPKVIRVIEDLGSEMQQVFGRHPEPGPISVESEDNQTLRQREETDLR